MMNDRTIKKKLYNHEVNFPADMWDRIERQLPPVDDNKNRLPLWLWLGSSIGLLSLIGGFYFLWSPIGTTPSLQSNNLVPPEIATPIIQHYKEDKDKPNVATIETLRKELERKEGNIINVINKKNIADYSDKEEERKIAESKIIYDRSFGAKETYDSEKNLTNEISINEGREGKYNIINEVATITSHVNSIEPLQREHTLSFDPPDCPTFYDDGIGATIEVYFGSEYGLRSISAQTTEIQPYASLRENTETPLFSFSAGARVSFNTPGGIGIKTGLHFSQINERLDFTDPDARMTRTVITIDTIFSGGNPIITSDTMVVTVDGTQRVRHYNRYRALDIPILASYERSITKKLSVAFTGGIYINFRAWQRGRYVNPSNDVSFFHNDPSQGDVIYKSSLGLSYYASSAFYYELNGKYDFMVEPSIRMLGSSITQSSYPLSQKYIVPSLKTGLRIKF